MSVSSKPNETDNQGPSDLRPLKTFITGHDSNGKAIATERPATWWTYKDGKVGFHVPFTTSEFPVDMNDDKDVKTHDALAATGKLGLVNRGGTVCRIVDFAPANSPLMHRTQSLDYGVVLDGVLEMQLDSGEVYVMKRGDVAVQRATQHAWKNASDTEWARMLFVLQDSTPLVVNGEHYKEDLSASTEPIPASGND